jgi:hypothetical protein
MSDHVVWDPKSVEARLQFLRIVETEGIWSAREFLIRENTKFPKSIRAAISQIPHRSGPASKDEQEIRKAVRLIQLMLKKQRV